MDDILTNAELEMDNSISNLGKRFNNIRAGRANPAIYMAEYCLSGI